MLCAAANFWLMSRVSSEPLFTAMITLIGAPACFAMIAADPPSRNCTEPLTSRATSDEPEVVRVGETFSPSSVKYPLPSPVSSIIGSPVATIDLTLDMLSDAEPT